MKSPASSKPQACLSRAEKVAAIQKAVQEGSYKVDSARVAQRLVMHLLNLQEERRRNLPTNLRQLRPTLYCPQNACLSHVESEWLH
jgi:hypothetical protein